jgi:hypothetical protein
MAVVCRSGMLSLCRVCPWTLIRLKLLRLGVDMPLPLIDCLLFPTLSVGTPLLTSTKVFPSVRCGCYAQGHGKAQCLLAHPGHPFIDMFFQIYPNYFGFHV